MSSTEKTYPKDPSAEAEEFLYIMTHDLKAFVRAMRLIPEWIAEDIAAQGMNLPADAADNITMLKDYASRMDATLNALTELSRIGRISDPPASHDLGALLAEELSQLSTHPRLTWDIACHDLCVKGAENDLRRLFAALVSNVSHHHDRDFGRIRISAHDADGRVIVAVCDDGPGIPPDQREAVFKPLTTLRAKSENGLVGLGLTIARKIVQAHGGQICIGGAEDLRGCCVRFDLPMAPRDT